jgi:transposase
MATIQLNAHDSVHALRQALKESTDAEQKTRIRAIINLKEGATKTAVAQQFAVSRTSIVSWTTTYNTGGVAALTMSKGGRPEGNPKWDTSIFEDLTKAIDKGGYWSIPKRQEWISAHYKKDIPEQTVWYHMDRLKYSYKGARPHPVQGNKDKQESFKKGASLRSWSR